MKIAPLFASEIKEYPNIISQYEKYGVDIISIIDDVEKIDEMQSINQRKSLILGNQERGCTIVYTGCKASINPLRSFWTNSFITHNKRTTHGNLNPYKSYMNISTIVNLNTSGYFKNYSFFQRNCDNYSSQAKIIPNIDKRLEKIKFANPYIEINQKTFTQHKIPFNKAHLYIWYVYNYINQQQPFTIGFPFTETIYSLVYHLNELAKILQENKIIYKRPLLRIYKYDAGDTNFLLPNDWNICSDAIKFDSPEEMLDKEKGIKLFLYCDYTEQFKYFKERITTHKQIYICKNILTDNIKVNNIDRRYLRKIAVQNSIVLWSANRSFEKLCGEVLNSKHLTISEMISHFIQKNKDVKLLKEAFSKVMPDKIRQNMNFNAPHNFLLHTPPQVILNCIEEIFTSIELDDDEKKNQMEDEQKKGKERRKDIQRQKKGEQDLQSKIRQTNDNKLSNAKINVICHYCQGIVKKSLVKTCDKCRNAACYQCLSKKYANRNCTLKEFQDLIKDMCSYCQGNCRCPLCSTRREKLIEQKQEKQRQYEATKYEIQPCYECMLQHRNNRKKIKIECDSCHSLSCLQCLKLNKQIRFNYEKNKWYCKKCRNLFLNENTKRIEEFKTQTSPIVEIVLDPVVMDKSEEQKKKQKSKQGARSRQKKKRGQQKPSSSSQSSSSSPSSSQSSSSSSSKNQKATQVNLNKKNKQSSQKMNTKRHDKKSNHQYREDRRGTNDQRKHNAEGYRNYNKNSHNSKGNYTKKNWNNDNNKKNNNNSNFHNEGEYTYQNQSKPGLWMAAQQERQQKQPQKAIAFIIDTRSKSNQQDQIDY